MATETARKYRQAKRKVNRASKGKGRAPFPAGTNRAFWTRIVEGVRHTSALRARAAKNGRIRAG